MDNIIEINNLTKSYGPNVGVFNVNITIQKGIVYGFLGPNGAGKSTTIRHLLGFIKPQVGSCKIKSYDCWKDAAIIQNYIGYVPGEIFFPDNYSAKQYLNLIAKLHNLKDTSKIKEYCDYFKINPNGGIKRMSKGMKQKIALVCAFMHDPEIYILDEPTSGLDPLMQDTFVRLIKKEKSRGKTILMSSHIFEEISKTCDRVSIIKQGEILTEVNIKEIEHKKDKQFEIKFAKIDQLQNFIQTKKYSFKEVNAQKQRVKVVVFDSEINNFISDLSKYKIEYISEIKFTLEDYFMIYYKEGKND